MKTQQAEAPGSTIRSGVVTRHIVSVSTQAAFEDEKVDAVKVDSDAANTGRAVSEDMPRRSFISSSRRWDTKDVTEEVPAEVESQNKEQEAATELERCFSLTVLSSDLPAGYLGRSLEPLTAGACRLALTAGDETRWLEARHGAAPQWSAHVVDVAGERHVPPGGVHFQIHQEFHCESSDSPIHNGDEAPQPDKSVTWRASLSANQIYLCNDGEEVKIMLVDHKGRPSRASVNVIFHLPSGRRSTPEALNDSSRVSPASTHNPSEASLSDVAAATPISVQNAISIQDPMRIETTRDGAQDLNLRGIGEAPPSTLCESHATRMRHGELLNETHESPARGSPHRECEQLRESAYANAEAVDKPFDDLMSNLFAIEQRKMRQQASSVARKQKPSMALGLHRCLQQKVDCTQETRQTSAGSRSGHKIGVSQSHACVCLCVCARARVHRVHARVRVHVCVQAFGNLTIPQWFSASCIARSGVTKFMRQALGAPSPGKGAEKKHDHDHAAVSRDDASHVVMGNPRVKERLPPSDDTSDDAEAALLTIFTEGEMTRKPPRWVTVK